MLKQLAVVVAVLALGAASIRSAAVASSTEDQPQLAQYLWPSHPLPTRARALSAIGAAAAERKPPPASALEEISALVRRDPLADEPFTVAGTAALADGRVRDAARLLIEATERDPRALAPRYLLADLSLRSGNVEQGLEQLLFLTRQMGQTADPLAPALATFARQPGAAAQLRPILQRDSRMRNAVLTALAADPASAGTILTLAEPLPTKPDEPTKAWQERLLAGMIERGDIPGAYRVWRRFALLRNQETGLFNTSFADVAPPPPFNWRLASGSAGVAEPLPGGGVRLLFYGREDALLASQTLLLDAGAHRLRWTTSGSADDLSVWVKCVPGDRILASAALARGELSFVVPAGCRAQQIEFRGVLSETPATRQPTVTGLQLTKASR